MIRSVRRFERLFGLWMTQLRNSQTLFAVSLILS